MKSYVHDSSSTIELLHLLHYLGEKNEIAAGNNLSFRGDEGEGVIYILHNGEVNLVRNHDKLIVNTYYGDDIIGLIEAFNPRAHHSIQTARDSIVRSIPADSVISEIEKNNYWYHLSVTLADMLNRLYHRERVLLRPRADEIVQGSIIELNNLPNEIKESTDLIEYIERRCPISKRTVERAVRALSERGNIETKGGKLFRVNYLPIIG